CPERIEEKRQSNADPNGREPFRGDRRGPPFRPGKRRRQPWLNADDHKAMGTHRRAPSVTRRTIRIERPEEYPCKVARRRSRSAPVAIAGREVRIGGCWVERAWTGYAARSADRLVWERADRRPP